MISALCQSDGCMARVEFTVASPEGREKDLCRDCGEEMQSLFGWKVIRLLL